MMPAGRTGARPIEFTSSSLRIIDQTKLPAATEVVEVRSWRDVPDLIRALKVRGAPAIGIVAAYGVALAAREHAEGRTANSEGFFGNLQSAADAIARARPTAANLGWAVNEMMSEARRAAAKGLQPAEIAAALETLARALHAADAATCRRIGDHGAALLGVGSSVLTHCNTGDFATGGYGTALGIIRSAWREGTLAHVFVGETRPMFQGARLTTWELRQDGIPHTLIADSMAAHFISRGRVDAVIVGADRIARNGDTANKIGTYALAVAAREHGVPFIVAAPRSTFDSAIADGSAIVIEERDRREVTHVADVALAPEGTHAENPAFDVTPAKFISAIVTEFGVLRPPLLESVAALLAGASLLAARPPA